MWTVLHWDELQSISNTNCALAKSRVIANTNSALQECLVLLVLEYLESQFACFPCWRWKSWGAGGFQKLDYYLVIDYYFIAFSPEDDGLMLNFSSFPMQSLKGYFGLKQRKAETAKLGGGFILLYLPMAMGWAVLLSDSEMWEHQGCKAQHPSSGFTFSLCYLRLLFPKDAKSSKHVDKLGAS